jgi:hypothetical protein
MTLFRKDPKGNLTSDEFGLVTSVRLKLIPTKNAPAYSRHGIGYDRKKSFMIQVPGENFNF